VKKQFRSMMTWSLLALGAVAVTTPAKATLIANINGTILGGTVVGGTTAFDNEPGVDQNPAVGILDVGVALDAVTVNFHIVGFAATSASPIGVLSLAANADLEPTAVLPLDFDIFISDNNFSVPPTPLTLAQTVNLLSNVGGLRIAATAVGYYGPSNTEFDVSVPATSDSTANVINGVATNSNGLSGVVSGPTPYSLTTHIHGTILSRGLAPVQNGQINSNLTASPASVPEPTTLMLLGTGFLGLAAVLRKKVRP
jgi:hypothetical protein